jgi:hypothetical protein
VSETDDHQREARAREFFFSSLLLATVGEAGLPPGS